MSMSNGKITQVRHRSWSQVWPVCGGRRIASYCFISPARPLCRHSSASSSFRKPLPPSPIAMSSSPKHPINLIRGWPAPDLLPASLLSASAQRLLADEEAYVPALEYGPDPGYRPLREGLATWLAAHYGVTPDAERIIISGGASQNVAAIMQSFSEPTVTKAVWLVTPTYHLVCDIFADAGFAGRLRAFPEDEEGVDLEALEERIERLEAEERGKPQLKVGDQFPDEVAEH